MSQPDVTEEPLPKGFFPQPPRRRVVLAAKVEDKLSAIAEIEQAGGEVILVGQGPLLAIIAAFPEEGAPAESKLTLSSADHAGIAAGQAKGMELLVASQYAIDAAAARASFIRPPFTQPATAECGTHTVSVPEEEHQQRNSEDLWRKMTGSMVFSIYRVSGPAPLDLSDSEKQDVLNNSISAILFLRDAEPSAIGNLYYELWDITINEQPPRDYGYPYWVTLSLQALKILQPNETIISSPQKFLDYLEGLRVRNNVDHAFSVWVAKYEGTGKSGVANRSYNIATAKYPGGRWVGRMDLLIAHEASHLFCSLDEYDSSDNPNTSTTPGGVDGVWNQNNLAPPCAFAYQAGCIMQGPNPNVCPFTRGQLGWWARKGLHVFYPNSDKGVSWTVWDSNANVWRADQGFPGNRNVESAFSTVISNNVIRMFYQGSWGSLWKLEFNGRNFQFYNLSASSVISKSPAAVLFNGYAYVFAQGNSENGNLMCFTLNPSDNAQVNPYTVPNARLSFSPSAVVFNNEIWVFYRGSGRSSQLWYSRYSQGSWGISTAIPNAYDDGEGPSAVVYANTIFLFRRYNGSLWYNAYQVGWSQATQVNVSLSSSPGACVYNYSLLVFYRNGNGRLAFASYGVTSGWSQEGTLLTVPSTTYNPAAITVVDNF